jgi:hypothetical protein
MSSARLPEHGGLPPLAAAPDPTPAGLFVAPTQVPHTAHLVPCAGCGALNGRSALTCWSCEADLLAVTPFAEAAPAIAAAELIVELVVESDPAAPAIDSRRGLHLVSRSSAPVSVQDAPTVAVPDPPLDLPVLAALVEGPALPAVARKAWYHDRPMIALALAAVALLAAAAGLRWLAPPPVAPPVRVSDFPSAPATPRADAAAERPFSVPAQGDEPDRASLSFPPINGAPAVTAADPPSRSAARNRALKARTVGAAPRPVPKPREIRETVSPPPAACTSNMAALGFCTLPSAAAKE